MSESKFKSVKFCLYLRFFKSEFYNASKHRTELELTFNLSKLCRSL